jgi:fructose-bisphosphate aldolase class II
MSAALQSLVICVSLADRAESTTLSNSERFGCEGMASKIKPVPLDRVASRYRAGELAQIVN